MQPPIVYLFIGCVFLTTNAGYVQAKPFSFASYYGDHMVLQQSPKRANIWGYASKPGLSIRLTVSGNQPIYTSSYIGPMTSVPVWSVQLPPIAAGGPYTITATSVEGNLLLSDVLFGDVWICSGQSNMQFTLSMADNSSAEIADANNYPNIRVFTVNQTAAAGPQFDLLSVEQRWSLANSVSVGGPNWIYFSAVCWLYAKYLIQYVKYPIGVVATSYGGTRVEAWSSPTVLKKCGVVDSGKMNDSNGPPETGSVLWNAMVHPLLNMTIYGAIWYQGESNAFPDTTMNQYNCTFPSMITDWRDNFYIGSKGQTDPKFPFGFVQLGAWRNDSTLTSGFTDIRWHQTADYGYVPNPQMERVFMSVAMDLPDYGSPFLSIHPRDKQDVAMRLVTAGLAVAYGQSQYAVLNGPLPEMYTIFEVDSTLQINYGKNTTLDIRSIDGFEITCMELANSTGSITEWFPLPVTSHDVNSVTLDYSKVCIKSKDMLPNQIRYAWRESPCEFKKCSVYNKLSGYPAPPFYKNMLG